MLRLTIIAEAAKTAWEMTKEQFRIITKQLILKMTMLRLTAIVESAKIQLETTNRLFKITAK